MYYRNIALKHHSHLNMTSPLITHVQLETFEVLQFHDTFLAD